MGNEARLAGAVAAGALVTAGTALAISTWSPRNAFLRVPSTGNRVETWATTPHEVRYGTIPQNARLIPILEPRHAPMLPAGTNVNTKSGRLLCVRFVRDLLGMGGRGNEDPRCVLLELAVETGWFRASWNNNLGNVKAQGSIYARSPAEVIATRQVYTTNYESAGVHILLDRVNSLDAYHAYDDPGVFMRRQSMLYDRTYGGVTAGFVAGGLEGLIAAERILGGTLPDGGRGPMYSGSVSIQREAMARWYWRTSERLCGTDWVR